IHSSGNSNKLLPEAQKIPQQLIKPLPQIHPLQKLPIIIPLYKQPPKSSILPPNFIPKTHLKPPSPHIPTSHTIKQHNLFFPSHNPNTTYKHHSHPFHPFNTNL
ncbi:CamS family sex pheromone protein, partial [Bacillus altitudinis]|uniref:CamS family sex pheromone protein n=1 Tax=Bacillus altitudinis TaxID=293387 RepID=UPI001643E7D0